MQIARVSAFGIVWLLASAAFAQNTAAGTFTVNGARTQFTHAYAFMKAPWNDKANPNLHVLVSDVPIPPDAIPSGDAGLAKMAALTRENKVHALELRFVHRDTTRLSEAEQGAVYHSGIQPARHGLAGQLRLEQVSNDGKVLKARVSFDPELAKVIGYSADATFEVALPPAK